MNGSALDLSAEIAVDARAINKYNYPREDRIRNEMKT
jgi:hypothetical protein